MRPFIHIVASLFQSAQKVSIVGADKQRTFQCREAKAGIPRISVNKICFSVIHPRDWSVIASLHLYLWINQRKKVTKQHIPVHSFSEDKAGPLNSMKFNLCVE